MADRRSNVTRNVVGVGVVAAALVYFLGGQGFGLGAGNGNGTGSGQAAVQSEAPAESGSQEQGAAQEIPDTIEVVIEGETVTINGNAVKDAEELKGYVEEYNSDTRKFVLTEKEAILETYNWVKGVFDEMGVTLEEAKR